MMVVDDKCMFSYFEIEKWYIRRWSVISGTNLGQVFAYIIKPTPPRGVKLTIDISSQYLNGSFQNKLS